MKIIFILVSYCLVFFFVLPTILDAYVDNQSVKALLFYVGVVILLGSLGDVYDWLKYKVQNDEERRRVILHNKKIMQ